MVKNLAPYPGFPKEEIEGMRMTPIGWIHFLKTGEDLRIRPSEGEVKDD